MTSPKPWVERALEVWDRQAGKIRFVSAVVELVLVPLLALSLVGQIKIEPTLQNWVFVPLALADTVNVAILLVAGYLGPRATVSKCLWCTGVLYIDIRAYRCTNCGVSYDRPAPPVPTPLPVTATPSPQAAVTTPLLTSPGGTGALTATSPAPLESRRCRWCGATRGPESRFCSSCGRSAETDFTGYG